MKNNKLGNQTKWISIRSARGKKMPVLEFETVKFVNMSVPSRSTSQRLRQRKTETLVRVYSWTHTHAHMLKKQQHPTDRPTEVKSTFFPGCLSECVMNTNNRWGFMVGTAVHFDITIGKRCSRGVCSCCFFFFWDTLLHILALVSLSWRPSLFTCYSFDVPEPFDGP